MHSEQTCIRELRSGYRVVFLAACISYIWKPYKIDKMKEDARAVDSSIKGMDESLTHLNKVEELRGTVEDKDKQI